jgi:hypothetical protein
MIKMLKILEAAHTIVSGYSTFTTLIRLISSGEKRPNCISWMIFSGALEYGKLRFAIVAVIVAKTWKMRIEEG